MENENYFRNKFSIAFFSSSIFGGLIEIYQGTILTNRTGDWVDFLANCIGATMGLICVKIIYRNTKNQ